MLVNFIFAFVLAVYSFIRRISLKLIYLDFLNPCVQLLIGLTLPLSVYNIPYKTPLCKMEFYTNYTLVFHTLSRFYILCNQIR